MSEVTVLCSSGPKNLWFASSWSSVFCLSRLLTLNTILTIDICLSHNPPSNPQAEVLQVNFKCCAFVSLDCSVRLLAGPGTWVLCTWLFSGRIKSQGFYLLDCKSKSGFSLRPPSAWSFFNWYQSLSRYLQQLNNCWLWKCSSIKFWLLSTLGSEAMS